MLEVMMGRCFGRFKRNEGLRLLSGRYFRRLQTRYAPDAALASALGSTAGSAATSSRGEADGAREGAEAAEPGDATLCVPVACINLLRCNMQARGRLHRRMHCQPSANPQRIEYASMNASVQGIKGTCNFTCQECNRLIETAGAQQLCSLATLAARYAV